MSAGADQDTDTDDLHATAAQLDAVTRDVLAELDAAGETHITRLIDVTGAARQSIHDRLDTLEDRELVETTVRRPDDGGQRRRHATLTEHGETLVEAGLLEKITETNANVKALRDRLERELGTLHARVGDLPTEDDVEQVVDDRLEAELAELDDKISRVDKSVFDELGRVTDRLDALDDTADPDRLKRVQESTVELRDRVDDHRAAIDDLEGRAEDRQAIRAEVADVRERLETLEGRVADLEETLDSLDGWVRKEQKTVASAAARAERNAEAIGALEARLADLEEAEESDSSGSGLF